jgi:hypothetical protein
LITFWSKFIDKNAFQRSKASIFMVKTKMNTIKKLFVQTVLAIFLVNILVASLGVVVVRKKIGGYTK